MIVTVVCSLLLLHAAAGQQAPGCSGVAQSNDPCGPGGITDDECRQLGCCPRSGSCYMWGETLYSIQGGVRPNDNPVDTTSNSSPVKCSERAYAVSLNNDWAWTFDKSTSQCKVYGARWHSYRVASSWTGSPDENTHEALLWAKRPRTAVENYGSKYDLLENVYMGCYAATVNGIKDIADVEYSLNKNNPQSCVDACRSAGYIIAGLQGTKCACSSNLARQADDAVADSTCSTNCPGDSNLKCGGSSTNSVYFVAPMRRFVGCYNDSAPIRKWTEWGASSGRSAVDCILKCSEREDISKLYYYGMFAFVSNNGDCTCSDQNELFTNSALITNPIECMGRCSGPNAAPDAYCGNPGVAAAYETITTYPQRPLYPYNNANWYRPLMRRMRFTEDTRIPIESSTMTGIPLNLFTQFPEMKAVLSPRLIISATDSVVAPFQAGRCGDNSCYAACGNIFFTEEVRKDLIDRLVIRQWYIDLDNLMQYVGEKVDRVYLYAQVVLIRNSYDFPFALQIRARQIIIDQKTAHTITVSKDAPVLADNYFDAKALVPEPDATFRKQTLGCARLLIGKKNTNDYNTAFEMLDDVVTDFVYNEDNTEGALRTAIRMGRANVTNILRSDASYVPFVSKASLVEQVDRTYENLVAYITKYDEFKTEIETINKALSIARELVNQFVGTSIRQWEALYDYQKTELDIARASYQAVYVNYTYSADTMEERRGEFDTAINNKFTAQKRSAIRGVFGGFKNVVKGIIVKNPKQIAKGAKEFFSAMEALEETLEYMSRQMEKIETMMSRLDELTGILEGATAGDDLDALASDVELIGQIHVMQVGWENMKAQAESVLRDPEVNNQVETEAEAFLLATWDTCNWGIKLSDMMLDLAETYRRMVLVKTMLDNKKQLKQELDEWINEADAANTQKAVNEMANHLMDVQEEIRFDVNMMLQDYCDYKNYERLSPGFDQCTVQPEFDAPLERLRDMLKSASDDELFWKKEEDEAITVNVVIEDSNTSDDCADVTECPVKFLREKRLTWITIPEDEPVFELYHQFRVVELRAVLDGVTSSNNQVVLEIESTGVFTLRKQRTTTYIPFYSRPVSRSLTYEIGNEDNPLGPCCLGCKATDTNNRCALGGQTCGTVFHRGAFATWKIEVRNFQADVTNVNKITLKLTGTQRLGY